MLSNEDIKRLEEELKRFKPRYNVNGKHVPQTLFIGGLYITIGKEEEYEDSQRPTGVRHEGSV